MVYILLSGGSGRRLWPLSNEIRSKQFLKLLRAEDGGRESMLQRVYRQIRKNDRNSRIVIATSRQQASSIINQIGTDAELCIEPCRRDTFPAIALSASYLHDVLNIPEKEPVIVCPVDSYVEESYFRFFGKLGECVEKMDANLYLIGIRPTYPSEKYGYILPAKPDAVSSVRRFIEKPDREAAAAYIQQGALWNSGVFAFRLGYLLQKADEQLGTAVYQEIHDRYPDLRKISFDYAVAEKEANIRVLPFDGVWKDIGTWNTLTEVMGENSIGNVIFGEDCSNVHAVNELNIPILCMGLHDIIVGASPDGVIVTDKNQSSFIKPYVDRIDQQIMYAEKSWGSYQVLDVSEESLTIKVILKQGCAMNYHSHVHRDEIWTVLAGEGTALLDGRTVPVKAGDVLNMKAGCRHKITAGTELQMIEVQLGKEISVNDKIVYSDHGDRIQ